MVPLSERWCAHVKQYNNMQTTSYKFKKKKKNNAWLELIPTPQEQNESKKGKKIVVLRRYGEEKMVSKHCERPINSSSFIHSHIKNKIKTPHHTSLKNAISSSQKILSPKVFSASHIRGQHQPRALKSFHPHVRERNLFQTQPKSALMQELATIQKV